MLLELYTPTGLNEFDSTYQYNGGYPKGPTTPGIRLWHVDAELGSYTTGYITTKPTDGRVTHVYSNSYGENHGSILGEDYYDYNVLQLIRNNTSETYQPTADLSSDSLFKQSSSFNMDTYSQQFIKGTKMNDGKALGWSFTVTSVSSTSATITLTKA